MTILHLNCGYLHAPPFPPAACHGLVVVRGDRLVLVDSGLGLLDRANPMERVGEAAIQAAGFQFHESLTAIRQIEAMGFAADQVRDIVLTHGDPDHVGGLADFPHAAVHLSHREHAAILAGDARYSAAQFAHHPHWQTVAFAEDAWFGLPAVRLPFDDADIRLVSLPGHTVGHCGVAIADGDRWLLHVGDAYYLRVELSTDDHPVSQLATFRAADNHQRLASLAQLRRLANAHADAIEMTGYHDFSEFPTPPRLP
ncbi:MBL fold metallo-hydrolase [Tuwongella immobilis]|uniref:Metallo-beta-lactamase domain-containing protein n=1 Tax=Tuwongella immobilis TaxID=692036 RepID=A0A6C2YJL4_9BACT|nr:MBL fold metallo-hydrolase [Tuwongella immobilis]VIP01152.1 Beta-lactamase domain protein OS=Planctomyces limnophilus (strain ATCC 43296 / DSM 3776 / IFAM 1008 / 290) GN=Plim_3173 PE=4 SV=1: Lactamase_B [Tuwongella immobilis]VTR97730.1 Beta-lactamase domain protein OS=Planctomyces limnophilus (strain ATCC 43296 / DSM 3776 / IFAM 1008 / 290) GN=Plim_3173 PE=4 SV=1: Lactamase_B [Tuwongella immobilis]